MVEDALERRQRVASARADFLSRGGADLRGVPDHVAASWRRSAAHGVRPDEVASEYHSELDFTSRLVRCAQPVIGRLSDEVADIPVSIALTDRRARILSRTESSAWIGRLLDTVSFAPGFGYAEGSVGTNGVGTVLEFGESVHIVGPEHFVESLQTFSCAGAPIRDPLSGRIEGVLDVSCLSDQSSPVMHSLVRSAARSIEHNLLLDRNQPQQALFDAYTRIDARCREAVVAVGQRVVMANTMMQTLVDLADREAIDAHTRFLMARHDAVDDRVTLPSGSVVRLRGTRVTVGGEVAGMVLVVTVVADETADLASAPPAVRNPRPTHVPSTARIRTGADRPTAADLVGTTPAWRTAARQIETALLEHRPLLVLGERGSGRFTLAAQLHHLLHPAGRVVALDAHDVNRAPEDTVSRLLESRDVPSLCVLRGLDRLTQEAVDRLLGSIGGAPGRGSSTWLAATAAEQVHPPAPYRALLHLFSSSVTVPALRHRGADIAQLATVMLADLAPHRDVRLTQDAVRAITRFGWPGNATQLRDALAAALSRRPVGAIDVGDLPGFCHSTPRTSLRPLDEVERDAIVAALHAARGNRVAAADALGLARSTLYRKIKHYGITR